MTKTETQTINHHYIIKCADGSLATPSQQYASLPQAMQAAQRINAHSLPCGPHVVDIASTTR